MTLHAIVLDGTLPAHDFASTIRREVQTILETHDWTVEIVQLADKAIADCTGCFQCWTKTPGSCIIKNDEANEITCKLVRSDLAIYLTPVVYGGYSYLLKRVLDRSIGMVLPFFQKVHGEIHHKRRYEKYPRMAMIGILPEPDPVAADLFIQLSRRNAINSWAPAQDAVVITEDMTAKKVMENLTNMFANVEVIS
ncbi:MAG: NAD(P)H-dependent oxidoreductase [Candidatus Thorarchaeota archaeon]|nr:NAD(P)H-dependent oxidoreductase [Candidatus Thorarchaeota archaeon]